MAFGVVMGFLPGEVVPECTASRIEYQSRSQTFPITEKRFYHPSMSALTWFAAALDALLDAEALVSRLRRLAWVGVG